MLQDPYAEEELIRHLQDRYGLIDDMFFINYDIENILARIGENNSKVGRDQIEDFENVLKK